MLRDLAPLCFVLLLGGCAFAPPEDAYTVKEVLADISAKESKLDGKVVAINGWLGECGGTNCMIFSTLDDAQKVASYRELPDEEWMPAFNRGLSIGGNDPFDARAFAMQLSEVVVYGEVNASWKKPADKNGSTFGCLDRCDDIIPSSIEKVVF